MLAMRVRVVGAAVLLGALVAGCGGESAPGTAPAHAPAPSLADVRPAAEMTVEEMQAEIANIERECTPEPGASRESVEARFGPGRPEVVSKVPVEAPLDSPVRSYALCENGDLWVQYDGAWTVRSAHYVNPHGIKGRRAGAPNPPPTARGLTPRLEQMRRIRVEYRRLTRR